MSLIVPELKQIVDRITVIAPTEPLLVDLFESMAFELTAVLAPKQKLNLQVLSPKQGPLRAWASFTLGRRAKFDARITMLGYALTSHPPSSQILEISDSFFIHAPQNEPECDKLLRLKFSPEAKNKPCVIAGLAKVGGDGGDLRSKALLEWSFRNFSQVLHLDQPDKLLKEGLEWVLSF